MSRARIGWVDSARGLGIVLVVFGHTLRGLRAAGIVADGPASRAADTWVYSFHMPLFFLLSGLFAARRADRSASAFLRDRLATVAYPYAVWSVIQTLIQSAAGRYTNRGAGPGELAGLLLYPVMQFWFLYVLLLVSLAYYALRRCGLGPAGTLAAFAAFRATDGWLPLGPWWPLSSLRVNGPYYALGSALDRHGWADRVGRAPAPALALAAALGYGAVTASVWRGGAGFWAAGPAVALAGVAASVALAALLARVPGLGFVRVLGARSLEVYVAHTIASAGLRVVLQKALRVDDAAAHLVVGTAGGLALPLLLAWYGRRVQAGFLFRAPAWPAGERRRADQAGLLAQD